jgi:Protein of unknown function (DUF3089)
VVWTVALVLALTCAFASQASAKTKWLCEPGLSNDPCVGSLDTTLFTPTGQMLAQAMVLIRNEARVDCFYVYPTVSDQTGPNANLNVDPVLRSIALYQAARFHQDCKIYAPVYRQGTIGGIGGSGIVQAYKIAYKDVLAAWKTYLKKFNKGRPFVLIGHSQGTFHLRKLVTEQIDKNPAVRKRMVSAILLGGNVTVRKGRDVGGDFKHVPACRKTRQLGCVVAFSTFDQVPPADAKFGRTAAKGQEVLCTNPAALGGGSGLLNPLVPTTPFAPGSIALGIGLLGFTWPTAPTPWIGIPGAFKAECSSAGGANVLMVTPQGSVPTPKPSPDATWGLHLMDGDIALGNLVQLVRTQEQAYLKRAG